MQLECPKLKFNPPHRAEIMAAYMIIQTVLTVSTYIGSSVQDRLFLGIALALGIGLPVLFFLAIIIILKFSRKRKRVSMASLHSLWFFIDVVLRVEILTDSPNFSIFDEDRVTFSTFQTAIQIVALFILLRHGFMSIMVEFIWLLLAMCYLILRLGIYTEMSTTIATLSLWGVIIVPLFSTFSKLNSEVKAFNQQKWVIEASLGLGEAPAFTVHLGKQKVSHKNEAASKLLESKSYLKSLMMEFPSGGMKSHGGTAKKSMKKLQKNNRNPEKSRDRHFFSFLKKWSKSSEEGNKTIARVFDESSRELVIHCQKSQGPLVLCHIEVDGNSKLISQHNFGEEMHVFSEGNEEKGKAIGQIDRKSVV